MMAIGSGRPMWGFAKVGVVLGVVWSGSAGATNADATAKPDGAKPDIGKSDAAKPDRETLLIIRHAEKPPTGLGQLSCRGLNRALALPSVIERKFGRPDAVFAPNPKPKEEAPDVWYDYVRPLATVEPTAIRFGLPVYADYPFEGIDQLRDALLSPRFKNAVVLVAWEHVYAGRFVKSLVQDLGGDIGAIPTGWAHEEFDAIWKVTIERSGEKATVSFAAGEQGLNDQPDLCPNSASPPLAQPSPFR